jgi:hypothetical protein
MKAPRPGRRVTVIERPFAFRPRKGGRRTHHLGEVHAGQPGKSARRSQCFIHIRLAGDEGAGLGAAIAQDAGELAGVDAGNRHHAVLAQVIRQAFTRPPAGMQRRQIADHQPGDVVAGRLEILVIAADVANVRIGERDDLAGIGRIGENFLIAGHGGVEDHLADGMAVSTDGFTAENAAVGKREYGWLSQEDLP